MRTIWRDLKVLQDAGFPLYDNRADAGRHSLWEIEEDFELGLPLKFSLAEVAALLEDR